MRDIVQGLNFHYGRARVAYVTFASTAQVQFYLDTYTAALDVLNAISIDDVQSGTDYAAAFDVVRTSVIGGAGNRIGVNDVVIFLSDGKPTLDNDLTSESASQIRNMGVKIYAVSIGPSVQQDVMNGVASAPSTMFTISVPTSDDVDAAASGLLDKLCQ